MGQLRTHRANPSSVAAQSGQDPVRDNGQQNESMFPVSMTQALGEQRSQGRGHHCPDQTLHPDAQPGLRMEPETVVKE